MSEIFSGLDKLGFDNTQEINLFEQEKKIKKVKNTVINKKAKITIQDILYDRKLMCPVCGGNIVARTVRAGKVRLMSTDTDLRPKYDILTPYAYDVILCNCCGYTALNRFFKKISRTQADWIKKQISNSYRGRKYPDEYTYEMAIERYKLALLNAVVKKVKVSEKAYICLKIAWLYRSYSEDMITNDNNDKQILQENNKNEKAFIEKAYEGFVATYQSETFPVCGMEEVTVMYLIGDLARRLGKLDESLKWISRVIISRTANERLKEKARYVKSLIKEEKELNNVEKAQ